MTPSIRGICFDLFNTLIDVGRVPESIGGYTADILGVDRESWRQICFSEHHEIRRPTDGLDTLRRLAHALDPGIPEARIRAAAAQRQRRFDYALRHVPATVLEVLDGLRRSGYRLALISNASTAEVRAWRESPLAPLFDTVLFSCECGVAKPEPAIYRRAVRQLSQPADACVFVGDGGSDEHRGAWESGMHPVWLQAHVAPARRERLAPVLAPWLRGRIETLEELPAWLAAFAAGERRE